MDPPPPHYTPKYEVAWNTGFTPQSLRIEECSFFLTDRALRLHSLREKGSLMRRRSNLDGYCGPSFIHALHQMAFLACLVGFLVYFPTACAWNGANGSPYLSFDGSVVSWIEAITLLCGIASIAGSAFLIIEHLICYRWPEMQVFDGIV